MHSFTFPQAFQWAILESLSGQFWPPGLMLDTPELMYTIPQVLMTLLFPFYKSTLSEACCRLSCFSLSTVSAHLQAALQPTSASALT